MTTATPAPHDVLERVDALGSPGTPVTTPEVADGFDCTQRTIYNRLEALAEDGSLLTKKVGANSRVWWRPATTDRSTDAGQEGRDTEHKQRRRALEERTDELEEVRNRLKMAAEAGSIGLWEMNVDEDCLIADSYVADWYGVDPRRAAEGAPIEEFIEPIHDDDTERAVREVDQAIAETGRLEAEYRVQNEDGEYVWLASRGDVEYDDDGNAKTIRGAISDITERKRREQREQFLLELSDTIRPLSDPVEIQHEAARVLGEQLEVDRAHYAEVAADENTYWIHSDYYRDDVSSVAGEHHLSDFDDRVGETLRAGEDRVVRDTQRIPETNEAERDAYAAVNTHAHATVPLIKSGRLTAFFSVDETEPREWTELDVALVEETAERTWAAVERARAEARLQESKSALERLNAAGQELIEASPQTIRERTADIALSVLNVDDAALWCYNETSGELEPHTVETFTELPTGSRWQSAEFTDQVWQAFISDTVHVDNDVDVPERSAPGVSGHSLRSRMLVPLGRHGVVCIGSRRTNAFDDQTVDLAEAVAATVETAWDRAESEQELERQNEELTRIDRLNALIRGIDQALVGADTCEEVHDAVCERLASSDRYGSAWVATYDAETESVRPQAWAGIDSSYLDNRTVTVEDTSSDDPLAAVHRTREMQVIPDVATNSRTVSWREDALEQGVRSLISVPLVYDGSMYGILTVHGQSPQPGAPETEVLAEFGQTIAHALHTLEATTTRRMDSVVELTFRAREATTPFARLSREMDCDITVEGVVPSTTDDQLLVFFTANGITPEELTDASRQILAIKDPTCLDEREEERSFRARLADPQLVSVLTNHGVVVRSMSFESGTATIVTDLPQTGVVSEFLDEFRQVLPDLELLARSPRTRPLKTQSSLRATVQRHLTARQLEVLRTAYESGFFESPRVQTGSDLAELFDISQSTFTYHLRNSQRRLCEFVFEPV